jgi:hypothetical protein
MYILYYLIMTTMLGVIFLFSAYLLLGCDNGLTINDFVSNRYVCDSIYWLKNFIYILKIL